MTTLIIGANGKIGRRACALAAERGLPVRAMIRDQAQQGYFQELGLETVIADLEGDMRHAVEGCDEIIFTAGSGPHTGLDKTLLIDLHGAIRAIDYADELGLRRFLMISAMGADHPLDSPEKLRPYMAAKHGADAHLRCATTPHVILKPGRLTDEDPSGHVTIEPSRATQKSVSRGNVAQALITIALNQGLTDVDYPLLDGEDSIGALFGPKETVRE